MTRLDSFIRRLEAQRICLDWAIDAVRSVTGAALEIGLGNGRTYDHVRARLNGSRRIVVFDKELAAHPESRPAPDDLLLGDFFSTMPIARQRLGRTVALAHGDVGSADKAASLDRARRLVQEIDPMLVTGAVIACDQDMSPPAAVGWQAVPLPGGLEVGRYYLYRKA